MQLAAGIRLGAYEITGSIGAGGMGEVFRARDTRLNRESNQSGQNEIYVQEFPEARNRVQISTGGGAEAYWRGDGRELFYRSGTRLMSVDVQAGAAFTAGTPKALFQTRFATMNSRGRYRPAPDGQRFLIVSPPARDTEQPASVLLNWTSALK